VNRKNVPKIGVPKNPQSFIQLSDHELGRKLTELLVRRWGCHSSPVRSCDKVGVYVYFGLHKSYFGFGDVFAGTHSFNLEIFDIDH